MFEAPSYNSFRDIIIKKNQSPKMQREIIRENVYIYIYFFFNFHQLILYQLTKFEAPSCNTFWDIMITNFQSPNLQREIINFHQLILYQLTKFEARSCNTFLGYHDYKFSKSKYAKGDNSKTKITFFKISPINPLIIR